MKRYRMIQIPEGLDRFIYEIQERRWFRWKTVERITVGNPHYEWDVFMREHTEARRVIAVSKTWKPKTK